MKKTIEIEKPKTLVDNLLYLLLMLIVGWFCATGIYFIMSLIYGTL